MKPQEALEKLSRGVRKFQSDIYPEQRLDFEKLGRGQQPIAMFITCADSRVVPNLITQTGPGSIFVERNPGNIVPAHSKFVGGVTASIEFAMLVLKVPLIVICGHTDCGVMKAVADPQQTAGMPALQQWMQHSLLARERFRHEHPDASLQESISLLAEYNVVAQVENLRAHPAVASRLKTGEVEVRGWVYDIADGSVRQADPRTARFDTLTAS